MPSDLQYWIGIGDIHGNTANLDRIPGLAGAAGVLVSGDMTNRGGVAEASRVIEAIARHNPRILAQIGNMDQAAVQEWLDASGMGLHARALELAPGLGIMGVGWSTPTPFNTPCEVADEQIGAWLRETHARTREFRHLILVCHNPPLDTRADALADGMHVGSRAVRLFIEEARPDICLTGHIHESRAVDRIGDTLVINPGDLGSGGFARITWDGSTLKAELDTVEGAAR